MTGWVEQRRSRPFRCCKLFHGFVPDRKLERSQRRKEVRGMGTKGGVGGNGIGMGMSDGSSDHKKDVGDVD